MSVINEELLTRTDPLIDGNIHGDIQSPVALVEGFEVAMALQLRETKAYMLLAASLYHCLRGDQERAQRNRDALLSLAGLKYFDNLYLQGQTLCKVPGKRRELFDLVFTKARRRSLDFLEYHAAASPEAASLLDFQRAAESL